MLRYLPNLLTCCNLLCGTLGVLYIFEGNGEYPVAYFVWLACLFDFLDGLAARALRINSPVGKELDSLADVISFGLLPAFFMYKLMGENALSSGLSYIAFLIVVCSAYRLAVFNVDETQSDSFKGLPTPANALFLTGLPFIHSSGLNFLLSPASLAVITIAFSALLVSRFDLFALKFKDFAWHSNKIRYTFLLLSVLLLVMLKFAAIPIIILFYILLSLGVLVATGKRTQ